MTEPISSTITRVAKIKQILPADGWEMEFKSKTTQKRQELACWAICEGTDGREFVTGLFSQIYDGKLQPCTEFTDFQKYVRSA